MLIFVLKYTNKMIDRIKNLFKPKPKNKVNVVNNNDLPSILDVVMNAKRDKPLVDENGYIKMVKKYQMMNVLV
jgi:hypothetical protein